MSEMFRIGWSYYKLVYFKGLNGYFIVVATALCATDVLTHRAIQIVLALVAGSKFLEGLVDDTLNKSNKAKETGETQQFYNPLISEQTQTQGLEKK